MATVPYDSLFQYVQPYVPGCPNVVISDALAEAAADFCVRSELWRQDLDSDTTVQGEPLFEPDIPTGSILEDVSWVRVNGTKLARVLDKYVEQADFSEEKEPKYYSIYQDNYIRLYPTPDASYSVEGAVVLKPSLSSAGVEDFLFETHGRTIAFGAIAKIAAIPRKEWSDLQLAEMYSHKFNRDTDYAKTRDFRKVPMRIAARPFA